MKRLFTLVLLTMCCLSIHAATIGPADVDKVGLHLAPAQDAVPHADESVFSPGQAFRQVALGKSPLAAAASEINPGTYVMTWGTLNSQLATAGGRSVTVEAVADQPNAYRINNFQDKGFSVVLTVDPSAGTFSIASQQVGSIAVAGRVDIAFCRSDGTPDYNASIDGVINADGTFVITSWWGIYGREGEYADSPAGFFYNTTFQPANGTMTSTPTDGSDPETYGVVITQQGNVVKVKNFANYGHTVEIVVNDDRTGYISQQVVYSHPSQGDVYTAAYTNLTAQGQINIAKTINVDKATDLRTITWRDWTILNSNGYFNLWSKGEIVADFDIDYPKEVTELAGSGQEGDPYRISTLGDLNFLSRLCANGATAGKYFAIVSDIDMSGHRFVPVGTATAPFEGVIDGGGHKLSRLTVEGASGGYAGLFGYASKASVIRNIFLDYPNVTSAGTYTAALVGYSEGDVTNCHVTNATVGSDYSFVAGIAGQVRNMTGCSVSVAQIIGLNGNVAGLAGLLTGSMSGCSVTDAIIIFGSQSQRTANGGLVGVAREGASISDSHFGGMLSSHATPTTGQIIGGIVGEGYKVDINRCFVVADIQGYTDLAITGGIAGHFVGGITDCFSNGRVMASASTYTGGLVGNLDVQEPSVIRNCYTSANVNPSLASFDASTGCRELVGNYDTAAATYENVWYDACMTSAVGSQQNGLHTRELTSASGLQGFDPAVWTFTAKLYPQLSGQRSSEAASLGATAIAFADNDNLSRITTDTQINVTGGTLPMFIVNGQFTATGRGATITRNSDTLYTLRLNGMYATDTLAIVNGNVQYVMYVIKTAPKAFEGDGTEESPFLIKTKDDLVKLAEITSVQLQPFTGTYFRMTNDIDMTGVENFPGIGCQPYSKSVVFGGSFDGNGHAIHNLVMDGIVWTTAPANPKESWAGGVYAKTGQPAFRALFGTISGFGKVMNLTIAADCDIAGGTYVAGIAINNNGKISNCRNYARIRSLQGYGAGIVVANAGTLIDCYNAGEVSVNGSYAAGIACYNYTLLRRVVNVGDISTRTLAKTADDNLLSYCGGISSYNNGTRIENAFNAGTIHSEKGYCGGIAAFNPKFGSGAGYNELVNVINIGQVDGATAGYTGSIVGYGSTAGKVQNVYWDNQLLPIMPNENSTHAGMIGANTSMLTSGETLDGFDTGIWQFEAGAYPVLRKFADEPLVKAAVHTYFTLNQGITALNITADAQLSTYGGLQWSLASGSEFSIDGSTLRTPAEVTKRVTDVLTATCGEYVKRFDLSRSPKLSLTGDGTQANPYQLASVDDWNTIATFVHDTKDDMEGQYVKMMNDIDFSGKQFNPIAIGGDIWNAHLLGDNHTLANINYTCALVKDANGNDMRNTAGKQAAIGKLGASGSISDLTISGTFTQTKETYVAAFVGELYGKISNCVNKATVTGTKSYRGGFAALAYEGAQFIDCVNRGKITWTSGSAGNGGGILAEAKGPVSFIRCGNEGIVEGGSTYHGGIVSKCMPSTFIECYNSADQTNDISFYGGLVANADGNSTYASVRYVFDRCYNTGNLSTKGNVGGLVASAGNYGFDATGCYNTGNITSGTVGTAAGLFVSVGKSSNITDCWNSGTVSTTNSKAYAAGLAKETKSSTEELPTTFTRCYNTGNIAGDGTLAAGLVSQPGTWLVIDECYNTGDVTAKSYKVGGFVANNLYGNLFIKNSWNSGNVTTGGSSVGGFIGYSGTSKNVNIYDCVNFGNVTSTNATPGTKDSDATTGNSVGGIAGFSAAHITRCYNVGTVKGSNMVGGIVGTPQATAAPESSITIANSYNMGSVESVEANTCGAIVGVNAEVNESNTTGKYWSEQVAVTSTYYLEGTCNSTLVAAGESISNASLASIDLGEGWHSVDDYTFPVLQAHADHPDARFHSAALVLADGDTPDCVTRQFSVGRPEGVEWTASIDNVYVDGNTVVFPLGEKVSGKLVMTATLGDKSKQYELFLDSLTSIDDIVDDGREILSEMYFDMSGLRITTGNVESGHPYIVVRTYVDGTSRAFKIAK